MATKRHSKLIIIGSGPAGYTAGIYAARAMLKPLLITGIHAGGQMTTTTDVENYPGFADVIQGPWLMEQMRLQAEHVGTEIIHDHIVEADLKRQPVPAQGRQPHRVHGRRADHRHGRQGALSRASFRATLPGLWRLGLRHLRRLLLSRQESDRGRRRQYRRRGGALSRQYRQRGDPRASPRRAPLREDPARAAVRQQEDRHHVELRARRGDGQPTSRTPSPAPTSRAR